MVRTTDLRELLRIQIYQMKGININLLVIFILFNSCLHKTENTSMETIYQKIKKQIKNIDLTAITLQEENSDVIEILQDIKYDKILKEIVIDSTTNTFTALKAAELILKKNVRLTDQDKTLLAQVYAANLQLLGDETFFKFNIDDWCRPHLNNEFGRLGKRFLVFDEKSITPLAEIVANGNEFIQYEGSEESTEMDFYRYRIKDFAAFYISKIKDIPMAFYQDFEKRDAEIERLKEILEND